MLALVVNSPATTSPVKSATTSVTFHLDHERKHSVRTPLFLEKLFCDVLVSTLNNFPSFNYDTSAPDSKGRMDITPK